MQIDRLVEPTRMRGVRERLTCHLEDHVLQVFRDRAEAEGRGYQT